MSKLKKSTHSIKDDFSSSGSSSSQSSDEEVDMQDLKSIKEYLSDRRELARQLFKSVKSEKIQMMLPQVLKKMDLIQLEELCSNELSGMSKARILSILNGKPMDESSNTTESDDSGPSLEIISDTEEWFTDEDPLKKQENVSSARGKGTKDRIRNKGKPLPQMKTENKSTAKKVSDNVPKGVQIKKEEDADNTKEKEGDSLLDLLELEMRARAIRALIRKEEDIVPNATVSAEGNASVNARSKSEHDEQKEKENCRRQLERIISAQQSSHPDDEDVVLVVQPTTTIELLSSESEGETHGGVRINKKLQNERIMEAKKDDVKNKETNSTSNAANTKENKVTDNASETTHKTEASKRNSTNNDSKINVKRKKLKKKSHTRDQEKSTSHKDTTKIKSHSDDQLKKSVKIDNDTIENIKSDEPEKKPNVLNKWEAKKKDSTEVSGTSNSMNLEEEKNSDLDEIIDLDNYCDDIDDIDNENDKIKNKQAKLIESGKATTETSAAQKPNGTETWASRYYQTDDVQNVIKESKIQSEIRKRLRERQRLSKLNAMPHKTSPSSSSSTETIKKVPDKDPLGSVDEYLALKQNAIVNPNSTDPNKVNDRAATDSAGENSSSLQSEEKETSLNTKNDGTDGAIVNTNPG